MRENRLSGSEGGGVANPALPTPIQGTTQHTRGMERHMIPRRRQAPALQGHKAGALH